MRRVPKVLVACLLLSSLMVPSLLMAGELPYTLPLEQTILPGMTTVHYAGQVLEFTTTAPIFLKLKVIGPSTIDITVTSKSHSQPPRNAPQEDSLEIVWKQWQMYLYTGTVPDEWSGIMDTEGGFTEK
jgi:hypothetical protein